MAISPPSDIVLDVARAVEPSKLEAARTELARRAGAAAMPGAAGTFSLEEVTGGLTAGASRSAKAPESANTYKQFESMVLQTFIQNMLPKDAESVYGKGMSGDMWKSMMAGKMAEVMAERGGIGIAKSLLADHYKDGKTTMPVGPVSRGPEQVEIDRQSMLSSALMQELQTKMARSLTDEPGGVTASTKI